MDRNTLIENNKTKLQEQLNSIKNKMKKELLSIIGGFIISFIVAILGGILQENDWNFIGLIVMLIGAGGLGLCLWGFFVAYLGEDSKKYNQEIKNVNNKLNNIETYTDNEISNQGEKIKRGKEKELIELKLKEKEDSLVRAHGEPIKSITLYESSESSRFKNKVCIFKDETILMEDRLYKFSDILNVDYTIDSTTVQSSSTSGEGGSKISNSNMVIRSGIGYAIGGTAGAIIGGATAKRISSDSETTTTTSETKHRYEIIVTLNNIEHPQVIFKLWKNRDAFYELKSIFTVILNKEKRLTP